MFFIGLSNVGWNKVLTQNTLAWARFLDFGDHTSFTYCDFLLNGTYKASRL